MNININSIGLNFMGKQKTNLATVNALKPLELHTTDYSIKDCASKLNANWTDKNRDEFILSCTRFASEAAHKNAKSIGASPDDIFQEIMVGIIEYVNNFHDKRKKHDEIESHDETENHDERENIQANQIYRIANSVIDRHASTQNEDKYEYIRDVHPIDERDLADIVMANDAPEEIDKALSTLSPRERKVIEAKYGLSDGTSKSLREICKTTSLDENYAAKNGLGKDTHLSHSRVNQIGEYAMGTLARSSRGIRLRDYMGAIDESQRHATAFYPESSDED